MAASSTPSKDERMAKTSMVVASTTTSMAAYSHDDITTLFATVATALREVATLKARALKEVWNIAAVTPLEEGRGGIGICGKGVGSQELLAKGSDLLKRTCKDVVLDIYRDLLVWPGRHLLNDDEKRKYFWLKTDPRGVVEIELGNMISGLKGFPGFFSIIVQRRVDLETDLCIL
ncbi:VAN3-binding protein [Arachis hypogaea]|nr:VAN3-binding protein [Arachis hypogaea]